MSKLSKTLIAAAVSGLLAIPAAQAADENGIQTAYYAKSAIASVKFSGSGCKSDGTSGNGKLDASLAVNKSYGAGIDGGIEGGMNTGFFDFSIFLLGNSVDGEGILVSSNSGRTLNMDTSEEGYDDLQNVMSGYVNSAAANCKNDGGYNYDTNITRYEGKINKKADKIKVRMDVEGTRLETKKGKDKNVKLRVKTGSMDSQAFPVPL